MSVSSEPMANLEELIQISKHPKFVAIGETGLDYYYTSDTADAQKKSLQIHINAAQETKLPLIIHARNADTDIARILEAEFKNSPFSCCLLYTSDTAEIQKKSLQIHINAAQETKLPLIIHARNADTDIASILEAEFRNSPFSCVMHCFSSSKDLAIKAIDLGFYLSMSGIAAFPKSKELREIFSLVPVERILVETDSPYLAPPPYRGKRNEPAYVVNTARVGAELFGLSYEEFALQTEENFNSLFFKARQYGKV